MALTNPIVPLVFEGKFGFYPCDYETFKKLKELKKAYWQTVYKLGAWFRWNAKLPENRVRTRRTKDAVGRVSGREIVGPWEEPQFCPAFGKPAGRHWNMKTTVPQHLSDHGILNAFEFARMPKKTAEEVTPLKISEDQINKLLEEVRSWK